MMWRRAYLLLVAVRLYFALQPSYLHPDENFQGPEVLAGRVYSYPSHLTWEFTTTSPIRSAFPLWFIYGPPMILLRWIWEGSGHGEVPPAVVFYTLRVLMFTLSFVLEDWALHELLDSPKQRRVAVILVASSWVTWTLQTHTFSNSVETLVVLWCLVLIGRIKEDKKHSGAFAASVLSFLLVLGTFNRITFPAFVLVPLLELLPHFRLKPLSLFAMILSGVVCTAIAITTDTSFYHPAASPPLTFSDLLHNPTITPLNNLLYNSDAENLAKHGLHPRYQHILVNLPQLLGPTYLLLFVPGLLRNSPPLRSALAGTLLLSIFPHQEARFLLPAVPLVLSSIRLPSSPRITKIWMGTWVVFNLALGVLMGSYHQAGIVPTQIWLGQQQELQVGQVFWWKTYSPPIWLLDGRGKNGESNKLTAIVDNTGLQTKDLMGMRADDMVAILKSAAPCRSGKIMRAAETLTGSSGVYLVAPKSATFLDQFTQQEDNNTELHMTRVWSYRRHLNLDDMDFGDDGVWPTLQRVVGRRGLVVWDVKRNCG